MRLRDRLIKGTVLNFMAVAFNQGSTLIINIIVARILLKEVFGEYAIVQNTLLTIATISQLATGYTASKYIAEYRSSDSMRAGRIMGLLSIVSALMAVVGALTLIFLSPWLADTMMNAPHLSAPLMIGAVFLLFSSINGYQTGALSGLEAYGSLAKAGIVSGIVAVFAISLGSWFGGLNGTLLGLSISAFVRCTVHFLWLRYESRGQNIKPTYMGSFIQEKTIIFKFALPAAIAGYYSMPMIWLANSFLVRQPGGYGEMGLFSAANNLRILILFLPNVINNVGLTILNNEKGKRDINQFNRLFKSNVLIIFIISLCCVLIIGVFGRTILHLFGKEFIAGQNILWLLVITSLFESFSIGLYQYIQTHSKIWHSFFTISIPREAFFVLSAYFLIQANSGVGLGTAYLGAAIIGLILHFALVVKIYKKEYKLKVTTEFNQISPNYMNKLIKIKRFLKK